VKDAETSPSPRGAPAPIASSRTIMIMAGGTGGHIFPALAVADHLRDRGWNVVWLGARRGMEETLVPSHGYRMVLIRFAGVRGKGLLRLALLPLHLLLAFWQSARALLAHRPDVVLGMGGYVSFPGGLMASLLNRPFAIHEQNSVAGLANRILAPVADRVMVAFPDPFAEQGAQADSGAGRRRGLSFLVPRPSSLVLTGNPVRREIAALEAPQTRYASRDGRLHLLVLGGSLGARVFNEVVPQALALVAPEARPFVTHQSGANHYAALRENYRRANVEAELLPFIEDMAVRYSRADIVLCRAGATTVAEIAAAGVAAILVPYPHAVDDHQTRNARYLSDRGAAVLLPQREFTPARFARQIAELDRARLAAMAVAARKLGRPDAARVVAQTCMELAA
jgi:UDP-N-acetylglucosamine--N-acetylmuramyl-(pentapeptide) pyrophosphoryl-undecaprenol N-acetylglucosamine transferase